MKKSENGCDVVLTGMGVVSPFGLGLEPFEQALKRGECAAREIKTFKPKNWCKTHLAAMVPDFPLEKLLNNHKESKRASRQLQLAWAALHLALKDGNLTLEDESPERIGLFTGLGRYFTDRLEYVLERLFSNRLGEILPIRVDSTHPNGTATQLTYIYHILGPTLTFCASSQSGIQALEAAILYLKNNRVDIAMVLSTDVITPFHFHAEAATGILSSAIKPGEAPRPFDREADGAVMAEGAVVLILERGADARARGKKIKAHFAALETLIEPIPFSLFDVRYRNMMIFSNKQLMERFDPGELDFIQAEGRGVPCLDIAESQGIREAFGKKADSIPVTSIQGANGHAGGTNALFQIVSTTLAFSSLAIPPIRNLENPAIKCDLNFIKNKPLQGNVKQALVLSHDVSGHHSAILMRK